MVSKLSYKEVEKRTSKQQIQKVEMLLNSDIPSTYIVSVTGVAESTVSKLRNGKVKISNLTISNFFKLLDYAETIY